MYKRQTIADCKSYADGTLVKLSGKVASSASGDFEGHFYVQEPDRSSGIRVISQASGIKVGDNVSMVGRLGSLSLIHISTSIKPGLVTCPTTKTCILPRSINVTAVSYTHLDVYKRQTINFFIDLPSFYLCKLAQLQQSARLMANTFETLCNSPRPNTDYQQPTVIQQPAI